MVTNNSANTYIVPTTATEVTQPSQPAFLAYLGTTDSNVTGNGTVYTLGSGNNLTEVFDQNSDFNVNGTFTAPVDGRYLLTFKATISGLAQATDFEINLITTLRTYMALRNYNATAGSLQKAITIVADMDATDTATYTIEVNGEAADTGDALGAADLRNAVSGCLLV